MGPRGSAIVCAAIAVLCIVVLLQEPPPPSPSQLAARRGEESFHKEAMCIVCHELGGRGGRNGPRLDHVAAKFIPLKGTRDQARQFFLDHMVDPARFRVGLPGFAPCPSYRAGLDERKLQDLAEYLLTLE